MPSHHEFPKPLLRILHTGETLDLHGNPRKVTGGITLREAQFMHNLIRERGCRQCMETGVAYGISTLAICHALSGVDGERMHYGVDPCQLTDYNGAAIAALRESNLDGYFEHMNGPSHAMLPKLLERGVELDFAFIDGFHTFDYTLLDVFYADKMLRPGGLLLMHDMQMPSKRKVWGFLQHSRRYRVISDPNRPSAAQSLAAMAMGFAQAKRSRVKSAYFQLKGFQQLLALEKVESWEPAHNFYHDF